MTSEEDSALTERIQQAFRDVVVEKDADISQQFELEFPPYNLDEINLSDCDIDMMRVTGKPEMLAHPLDHSYLQCFGSFKRNKRLNGMSRIVQEPWQIWIHDHDVWNLLSIVRKYYS